MSIHEIRNRKILLDSNIPILYAHQGFIERSGNPLRMLQDNGNALAVPPIVGYEILCDENSDEVRKKYLKFLNYLPTLEMDPGAYQNAALLAAEYRRLFKGKKVPLPDLLIGGLIAQYSFQDDKPLLLTSDRNDFCEPLWKTVASLSVQAENSDQMQTHLYLLELNTNLLKN